MRAMSVGVAVSPSTAAAGLLPDRAPRQKVSTEAKKNTVTETTSSRPTGRASWSARPAGRTFRPSVRVLAQVPEWARSGRTVLRS